MKMYFLVKKADHHHESTDKSDLLLEVIEGDILD